MKKAFGALDTGASSYEKQSNSNSARFVRSACMTQCNRS